MKSFRSPGTAGLPPVIMSADDLESLNETLRALRTPGISEELAKADADYSAGNTVSGEQIRQRYGLK